MLISDLQADLAAIRIASVNPILDPWIYILLRRSLFRRLLSLSRRGSSTRSNASSTPQRNLFYPDIMRDSHVFTQLMCSANIITQLPATVKFTPYDPESLQPTSNTADWGHGQHLWMFAARCRRLGFRAVTCEMETQWRLCGSQLDGAPQSSCWIIYSTETEAGADFISAGDVYTGLMRKTQLRLYFLTLTCRPPSPRSTMFDSCREMDSSSHLEPVLKWPVALWRSRVKSHVLIQSVHEHGKSLC